MYSPCILSLHDKMHGVFSGLSGKDLVTTRRIVNFATRIHTKTYMNKEFIVLSRQDAVARNNSPYVNLKVANNEEIENICVFDVPKRGS